MKKQLEHSTELITAKAGLLICDTFEKYIGLPELIDSTFPNQVPTGHLPTVNM